ATEAVYRHPLHPYTQTLLASVPQADPILNSKRRMFSLTMHQLRPRQA
ncbi:oligopeptide ABC transporter ATP-binding protein, partial [Lacticaseibacillus rhamnosus MTCC 5462]